MQPLRLEALAAAQLDELEALYHATRCVRVRTRAQIVLLAAEQGLLVPQIAAIMSSATGSPNRRST